MSDNDNIVTLKKKRICCNCAGEPFLSNKIIKGGKVGKCSYCEKRGQCVDLVPIAERIEDAFEQHYRQTPDPGFEHHIHWSQEFGLSTVEAIQEAAEIPERAAEDLQEILADKHFDRDAFECSEETPFSSENRYARKPVDTAVWLEEWRDFENTLATETRFFSRFAVELLDSIFKGIEQEVSAEGFPVVVEAGPETPFHQIYRARSFRSPEELEEALKRPDLHLGPPPTFHARMGRMNADGISVFYGAKDEHTALVNGN